MVYYKNNKQKLANIRLRGMTIKFLINW